MGQELEFKNFIPYQITLGAKSNSIVLITKKTPKLNSSSVGLTTKKKKKT
jgi:hypothetical protein